MPGEGAGKAAEEGGWDPPRGRARAGGAAAGRGGDGSCGAGANYGALPARGFGHSGMRARPSSSGRRPRSRQHQARLVSLAPPGLLPTPSRARAASFSPFVHVFARRLFIRGGFSVPRPGSRAVCPADSTARGRAAGIPGALFNSRPVAVAALTPLRVRPIDRAELTTGFFSPRRMGGAELPGWWGLWRAAYQPNSPNSIFVGFSTARTSGGKAAGQPRARARRENRRPPCRAGLGSIGRALDGKGGPHIS
mmetsp:Transcript_9864/g.33455  ORF Transcript_9864/g.33455 Transcript_9864/m.33455 type:complete len:251 (-) Transcript_9864:196-948(-)